MAPSSQDIDEWARAYVEAQQDPSLLRGDHPLWWTVERFMSILGGEEKAKAEDAWKAILRILELDPPDEVVAILAAGPLEDLIDDYGSLFIDRIEIESRRNSKFRHLLGGVWKSSRTDIWARVEACRGAAW
jgi:hypothetical protein